MLTLPPDLHLVILGHVLNELAPEEQLSVVAAAWRLGDGILLIVEPGIPEGFAVVRAARDALLAEGAHTIAPCAHHRRCPLERDWCHCPQRLKRPDFQRRAQRTLEVGGCQVRLCRPGALPAGCADLGPCHPRVDQQQSLRRGQDLVA
jgi:ribosomal protein RSM22 (predicted rRNA methylase)